jgi:hypothetical protein
MIMHHAVKTYTVIQHIISANWEIDMTHDNEEIAGKDNAAPEPIIHQAVS